MLAQYGQISRKIWIVEFDPNIAQQLTSLCEEYCLHADVVDRSKATGGKADHPRADLIIICCAMANSPVLALCQHLRRSDADHRTSVIIVSGDAHENNMIAALEAGADDYVATPFSPRELVARIGALLRRSGPPDDGSKLRFADIELDRAAVRVTRGDTAIHLGPTEFRLLRHFMEHPNWVLSRDKLSRAIREGDREVDLRSVDVHILRLRKALNSGGLTNHIHTIRSLGYYLGEPAA
ncbi:winged helix-turn-helix domain-containing protein [Parasphingorhabdus sp.]|uniref:winged helix-turn-helix domain-containing protein n=1 Tax=Parasphingorhabdus sp. TaxID=2709688 RepID=UPI003A8F5CB6